MNRICIHMDKFETTKEFHLWLKEVCNFPEYYGCNLDALYDCLSENNNFEFEVVSSIKFEKYQERLVDTMIDAGCKVFFLIEE